MVDLAIKNKVDLPIAFCMFTIGKVRKFIYWWRILPLPCCHWAWHGPLTLMGSRSAMACSKYLFSGSLAWKNEMEAMEAMAHRNIDHFWWFTYIICIYIYIDREILKLVIFHSYVQFKQSRYILGESTTPSFSVTCKRWVTWSHLQVLKKPDTLLYLEIYFDIEIYYFDSWYN
jgi:hypothetical protein